MSIADKPDLRAPFPAFGGKSTVASIVWDRFGSVRNYVEPFCRSCAVLLGRPSPFAGTETVNDLDGWICNVWRALQADPDAVATACDRPVSELDVHAIGDMIFYRDAFFQERCHDSVAAWIEWLRADVRNYDPLIAGWWLYGSCAWIGTGWGPRQLPHLGSASRGVNRQLPHLGDAGQGDEPQTPRGLALREYLRGLSDRLRGVRICCGDWSRVCGPTPTVKQGLTAIFFDPPYAAEDRADCYDSTEDRAVSADVRAYCLKHGDDPLLRVALCGYEGEHDMPESWECVAWKARGGFGSQAKDGNDNCKRERIWFSPHCIQPARELRLF